MTAVATLAFAVSSANKATDDTSEKQAQIRFATLRISELIRHSKLICHVTNEEMLVWRADDAPGGDNGINVGELVYIETSGNTIRLMDFVDVPVFLQPPQSFTLAQLSGAPKDMPFWSLSAATCSLAFSRRCRPGADS